VKGPPERPLDPLPSLKLKLSIVILAAVAVTVVVFWAGVRIGMWPSLAGVIAGIISLVVVFFLSRGLTSPLREMVAATEAMARGDFSKRVTATSHDEVGTLARSFNQMAAELAETDRMRRDLVANVSHELRTPITALQAVLENIVDGVDEPDPETFATMLSQVERLGRLVQQLLDLSRLESGTLALDLRQFEIQPMLDLALRESRLHAGDIALDIKIEPRPFSLEADDERLHQVVANLVENAVRHSPRNGRVLVKAIATADGARLEVIDEGPGIPEAEAGRVFERFYRADSARSSRDGGAGLGLAIARWIVELHGGDIRAERAEPHGCRMIVHIPGRIEIHEPPAPLAEAPLPSSSGTSESLSISERG
jgi:signal transduction histidine kinase